MIKILGVRIDDLSVGDCLQNLEHLLSNDTIQASSIFFVNAHTLNTASSNPQYNNLLNSATHVFGDGTGIRWAARLRGTRLRANLNGSDLVPALLEKTRGYRCFLLGGTPELIERAAETVRRNYPGWEIAGVHHGFSDDDDAVIATINAARPHLLLVGMGNPLQEQWIHRNLGRLDVRLCIGVGGLFHYWSGDLRRARPWIRRIGFEWVEIMLQQPHKCRRYLFGNPLFLYRMVASLYRDAVPSDFGIPGPRRGRRSAT